MSAASKTARQQQWDKVRMIPCRPDQLDNLIDFLGAAFAKRQRRWFATYLAHVFQHRPDQVKRHRIVTDAKGIAGCIGIYPMRFRVGSAVLKVGGVGQVGTRADLRGSGLMSFMLRDTVAELGRQRYDLSWLGGNRFRYGNYGWDFGGRGVNFVLYRRDVERYFPKARPAAVRPAGRADTTAMARLYAGQATRSMREPGSWPIHLRRKGFTFEVARTKGRLAYLVFEDHDKSGIVEVAGRPGDVLALLLGHCRRHKVDWLRVLRPDVQDDLAKLLFRVACDFSYSHRSQVRIVSVDSVWRKLLPEIAGHAAGVPAAKARRMLARVKQRGDRELILRRALGFLDTAPAFPPRLAALDWVRPVKWFLSPVEQV